MSIGISQLDNWKQLEGLGIEGEIVAQLVKREGTAIWIPDFVNWLLENYELHRKELACR